MGWLRQAYRKIPWVKRLEKAQRSLDRLVRLQQEQYLADLLRQEKYADPRRLAHFEFQVYSQNGEDGILQEIFRRVGARHQTFVEIGTGAGLENNTVCWLSQGWRGVWVEGSPKSLQRIHERFARPISSGALQVLETFVTRENIGPVLRRAGVSDELDLLSLDVDLNTYWVWEGLAHLRPRVAVIEYNASYPPPVDWKVAYDPKSCWDESLYYGASLKALERLGKTLGMNLVACDLTGTNAFFVRSDLCGDHFAAPFDAETHYEPPRLFLLRTWSHPRGAGDFRR